MSTEIELKQDAETFRYVPSQKVESAGAAAKLVEMSAASISDLLPPEASAEKYKKLLVNCILNTPKLYECTQLSLMNAIRNAAEVGLDPGTSLQLCWILPFFNNKAKVYEATFVMGYRGFVQLFQNTGVCTRIKANVVKDGDFFEYEDGYEPILRYKPAPEADRGRELWVYAYATTTNGGKFDVVLPYERIEQIRQAAFSKNSPAWRNHWDEQAKKTAIKNLSKVLPISFSPRLVRAIEIDSSQYDLDAFEQESTPSELDKLLAAPESGDGSEVDAPALEVPKPDTAPQEANVETIPEDIEPAELFKMCDLPGGEERKIAAALLGKDAEGFPSDLSTLTRNHKRKIAASVRIIGADRIFDFMAWAMNNKIAIGTPAAVNAALKNFSKL